MNVLLLETMFGCVGLFFVVLLWMDVGVEAVYIR